MKTRLLLATAATFAALALPLAGHAEADTATYRDFGEKAGLVRIMDDFMLNLLADPRTRPFFRKPS